ncbi:hypothetical protein [Vibrio lentus]|uniref:hypothetical protein n=1 Tax=Vibrio lentus TaxID=136468 RepID=UPI0010BD3F5C|nr:hypothetical protein [Vibrio lentus]TKG17748.1 hypothetical protein FCW05_12645 [Vibrio lentus]
MEGKDPNTGQFIAGHKGFKPKGSRTALTKRHLETIAKKIHDSGEDVSSKLYQLLEHPDTSPDLQFKILSKLMDFSNDTNYLEEDSDGNQVREYDRTELLEKIAEELS